MGYIYLLKNNSFEPHVLKIGRTTKEPSVRAKQLYWGSTGVPEHFTVCFACEVPDCNLAEKIIHKKANSYRQNNRREFFLLPLNIAVKIMISTCVELFGKDNFKRLYFKNDSKNRGNIDIIEHNFMDLKLIELYSLKSAPIGTTKLTNEQKERISILRDIFFEVYSDTELSWKNNFTQDRNPEKEIVIWEHIAKSFIKMSSMGNILTKEFKFEAYGLLLMRSMKSRTNVLKNIKRQYINEKQAKYILNLYELKPIPILIKKTKDNQEYNLNISDLQMYR